MTWCPGTWYCFLHTNITSRLLELTNTRKGAFIDLRLTEHISSDSLVGTEGCLASQCWRHEICTTGSWPFFLGCTISVWQSACSRWSSSQTLLALLSVWGAWSIASIVSHLFKWGWGSGWLGAFCPILSISKLGWALLMVRQINVRCLSCGVDGPCWEDSIPIESIFL